jgi:hypothetical protein
MPVMRSAKLELAIIQMLHEHLVWKFLIREISRGKFGRPDFQMLEKPR